MRNLLGMGTPVVCGYCGRAPPPPTGAVARLCLEARPCPPHRSLRRPPCRWGLVSCWRATTLPHVRYKILPARLLGGENGTKLSLHVEKAPNRAISGELGEFCTAHAVRGGVLGEFCTGSGAVRLVRGEFCTGSGAVRLVLGEFCTAHAVGRGVLGEFCTEAARRGSCWARFVSPWHLPRVQLPGFRHPPAPQPGPPAPCSALDTGGGGGFALYEAFWRCVAGVSDPRVVQFPPIDGGAPSVRGGAVAKVQTHWVKTVK